jgi:CheY-like chemotaxis protein
MPGMSGQELYARILSKKPMLAKRILFITGDALNAEIKAFLIQNDLPSLAKPFNHEDIQQKIDELLKKS